jgi:hypothetical protein
MSMALHVVGSTPHPALRMKCIVLRNFTSYGISRKNVTLSVHVLAKLSVCSYVSSVGKRM